ncbi:HAD family hydrolase [Pelagibius litoralis]|uniref:HAD family hydrolase n=1 Tax=Pelagibius litoralis TaxID=374515 RepID=A0A967F0C3_9PROT|nr:HAD family hydrolase [Pelagibius litoralis]NIA70719.1 HAD family hydrolase [Pelagibius litoralis]
MIDTLAFDADDTLWHNEHLFQDTQQKLAEIVGRYRPGEEIAEALYAVEMRNLALFGYGIKGFTLSMVEAAIDLTASRISAQDVHRIVALGKAMMTAPVEMLEGVEEVLADVSGRYRTILITKGDMVDQTSKIERSGLAGHFDEVEIVARKDAEAYSRVFDRHVIDPARTLMVGNSMPSDILPVLELGGHAAHVPYAILWAHEAHDEDPVSERFHRLERMSDLRDLLCHLRRPGRHS